MHRVGGRLDENGREQGFNGWMDAIVGKGERTHLQPKRKPVIWA
jgi:hypothetical protein